MVKATTVGTNLPTCKGSTHIDLEMKWDQSRLDEDLIIKGFCPLHKQHPKARWRRAQAWAQRGSSSSVQEDGDMSYKYQDFQITLVQLASQARRWDAASCWLGQPCFVHVTWIEILKCSQHTKDSAIHRDRLSELWWKTKDAGSPFKSCFSLNSGLGSLAWAKQSLKDLFTIRTLIMCFGGQWENFRMVGGSDWWGQQFSC